MDTISKAAVLDRAKEAVADRGLNYGKPEDNFLRIARRWVIHFKNRYDVDIPIDATDVAIMMDDVKTARLENKPDHLDSWVDKAGYAACGANISCENPAIAKLQTQADQPVSATTAFPPNMTRG